MCQWRIERFEVLVVSVRRSLLPNVIEYAGQSEWLVRLELPRQCVNRGEADPRRVCGDSGSEATISEFQREFARDETDRGRAALQFAEHNECCDVVRSDFQGDTTRLPPVSPVSQRDQDVE